MASRICFTVLLLSLRFVSSGQSNDTPVLRSLPELTITAFKEEPLKETSLNIVSIKADSLKYVSAFNITDILAKLPGVNMLSTGLGISKPVIRGLYGNRILILLSGLKFDNQQWQEEHGLGLNSMGISRLELIKGPMSVLYGSEAIGGVINIIEEAKPTAHTSETDVSLKFNSNTLGGGIQAGYKVNKVNKWFRIRAGIDNHADYSDGNNQRVLNSRFDGYSLKSTYGFTRKKWQSENNFLSSFNRFGFIFNDVYTFVKPDARWSRKLNENPSHVVLLNILSSENKFYLNDKSKLSVNAGIQSNERLENEGSGAISLDMHLLTFQYLAKYEKILGEGRRIILSHLNSFEDNTNYGSRKIVPDARMQEANFALYYEADLQSKLTLENGLNIGEKWIKTFFTAGVNGQGKEVQPFNKFSLYYNFYSGLSFNPNEGLNIKANASTGVRIPNLAELSSNGLHEGVFTYEIGDPLMKNEQNIGLNFIVDYKTRLGSINISPFYNYFFHYVYLAPTQEEWFGFPVYRYKQQNARQIGFEIQSAYNLNRASNLNFTYSMMQSKTQEGNYTPFIPASKFSAAFLSQIYSTKNKIVSFQTEWEHYFQQNNIYTGEIPTHSYNLFNASVQAKFLKISSHYSFSISGQNLFNKSYYDHLSRLKYFGLNNIGRNIFIQLKYTFSH
ncbi:MAG: TonB-dependent receptor [Saprospiraceae bacterium]